jgi:predicted regulator of Ras-like GTPase activity (Roadblock/LC7/MglB family)
MLDERRPPGSEAMTAPSPFSRPRSHLRARAFKEIVAHLAQVAGIRGVLLVTPDGLVITAALPPRAPIEALAALGAALGRELEVGSARLGRGRFRLALFRADEGTFFVGASRLGFLIALGDQTAHVGSVQAELAGALDRL